MRGRNPSFVGTDSLTHGKSSILQTERRVAILLLLELILSLGIKVPEHLKPEVAILLLLELILSPYRIYKILFPALVVAILLLLELILSPDGLGRSMIGG